MKIKRINFVYSVLVKFQNMMSGFCYLYDEFVYTTNYYPQLKCFATASPNLSKSPIALSTAAAVPSARCSTTLQAC